MYGSQSLVPSSMMTYPTPLYHHPSAHRFSLSPSAGNNTSGCPQNYYPGHVSNRAAAAALYGTYDGLFPNFPSVPSDPCKQALMMASQAAGFSGMGNEYSSCIGKFYIKFLNFCI